MMDIIKDMSKVPVGSVALDEAGTTWVKHDSASWFNVKTTGTFTLSELKRAGRGPKFLIYEADHSWKERFKTRAHDGIKSIISELNEDNERLCENYVLDKYSSHQDGRDTVVVVEFQVSKVWS